MTMTFELVLVRAPRALTLKSIVSETKYLDLCRKMHVELEVVEARGLKNCEGWGMGKQVVAAVLPPYIF